MKIKMKLIIVAAVLLIITTTAFSIFLSFELSMTAKGMSDTFLSDMAAAQTQTVDSYVDNVTSRFEAIKSLSSIKTFLTGTYGKDSKEYNAAKSTLDALVAGDSSAVTAAVVYDGDKNVLLASGSDKSSAVGICDTSAKDNTPVIFSSDDSKGNYKVSIKSSENKNSLGIVFSSDALGRIIQQSKGYIIVVDADGNIAGGNSAYGGRYGSTDKAPNDQYQPYEQGVSMATAEPQKYMDNNTISFVAASANNWKVVSYQQESQATAYASQTSAAVTGISVAVLVVCLVVAIILIVSVTKPFYKIQETLMRISRGDHEARVDIVAKNEYGEIARVFNDIVDDIIVSESRYRTIIEMSDNIIFEWNMQNNEVTFSNNFNKKFSYRAPSDHFADSFLLKCKVHPEDSERYKSDLEKLSKGENFKHNEYRIKNIYGDYIWVLIRTQSILDQNDQPVKIVGVIVDIDRSKKNENVLTARASFDALTQVYNRETIETVINNEIELIAARKVEFAILFIDIDDFKFYNDQYSHATGDQVLKFTATTIKNAVGDKGSVGRYGGDEFIVCIKEADSNDPALIAEQILNTLKEGFDSDSGDRLTVNVSIGISIIRDNTKRVEEIIGQADDAMYKIKKSGKSNFGFLDTSIQS